MNMRQGEYTGTGKRAEGAGGTRTRILALLLIVCDSEDIFRIGYIRYIIEIL